jgi:hypothetical protein
MPRCSSPRPADRERVGEPVSSTPQRDVALQLLGEPIAELAAGHVLPFTAREGRGVHHDVDRDGRLLDLDPRQRLRVLGIGDRGTDLDLGESRDRDDVAGARARHLGPLQTVEDVELGDLLARSGREAVRGGGPAAGPDRRPAVPRSMRPIASRPRYGE